MDILPYIQRCEDLLFVSMLVDKEIKSKTVSYGYTPTASCPANSLGSPVMHGSRTCLEYPIFNPSNLQ